MKKLLPALLALVLLSSCGCQSADTVEFTTLLGAEVGLYFADSESLSKRKQEEIKSKVYALAEELDNVFSLQKDSPIAKYNALSGGQKTEVPLSVKEIFFLSKSIKSATNNSFDPSVKHLVDLWGFSYRYAQSDYKPTLPFDRESLEGGGFKLPDNRYIDGFLSLASLDFCTLKEEDGSFYLEKGEKSIIIDEKEYFHALDFSAIVKGYFCDKAAEIINSFGATDFYLTVGGSSLYLGQKLNGNWELGLVDPNKGGRETFAKVKIKNQFVSASGTYENYYTVEGKTYSHIIDNQTGKPVDKDLVSATLIADSGAYTDAVATALIAMGKDGALEFLKANDGVYYVLVGADGSIHTNLGDRLVIENE